VLVPGVPTIAAGGVPGYEAESIQGMWAPASTPAAIISRLHQEFVRALTAPDTREKQLSAGQDVAASTPEQFAAVIKAEMARMGKVIRDAGIREE
jgi:tripartite-type tricarboxylate transporter receptor subunit TctC